MLLNSQNRNSVSQVLSASNRGLVLDAVVTLRSASLSKRRIVSMRPTRLSIGGTAMFPGMEHAPADGHRHSTAKETPHSEGKIELREYGRDRFPAR